MNQRLLLANTHFFLSKPNLTLLCSSLLCPRIAWIDVNYSGKYLINFFLNNPHPPIKYHFTPCKLSLYLSTMSILLLKIKSASFPVTSKMFPSHFSQQASTGKKQTKNKNKPQVNAKFKILNRIYGNFPRKTTKQASRSFALNSTAHHITAFVVML